ncbi:ketol-acid reductoisomerase [Polychytrium aggregatum]|uniref:ketol-acid reductoisomerase n=1 Tax=Polychytrium aggregatum TaxID=110093 RepID=UPI0022FDFB27|nr:ketol-acid reductoisomerase [Polychytrium aggregatum]KAI9193709.1 ketol-acid reductoisomerase [Polychytrium aggregatum]
MNSAVRSSILRASRAAPRARLFSGVAARAASAALSRSAVATPVATRTQQRGVKTLDFGGTLETIYERADFPKAKLQELFKDDTLAMIGYGSQGRGQSLNARDQGLNVIVGVRKGGVSWSEALKDGWVEGKTLFPIEEALERGTVIMNLLSDAGQKDAWPAMKPYVTKGKTLYFAHGFGVVFHDQTGIVPPADVDVVLVAPKGSGTTVRSLFQEGRGINASFAVYQDVSGKARERALGLAVAVGAGYIFETTFEKEVHSDLVGERGILMGAIEGLFRAQYEVLRAKGHSPSEAFNETVEEATQSLYPLIGSQGMDWMYANCSTTARRGAIDWAPEFHKATKPVFQRLYAAVENGSETRRTLEFCGQPDYRKKFDEELKEIADSEMWRAGITVRSLRPENSKSQN